MLRRRPFAEPLVALAIAVLAFASGEARAGSVPTEADINQARERFSEARRLEDAGRWSEALTVLQRVAEVKMTPQVRFHIALCMEHVGLWTQALDGYAQAAGEAGAAAPEVVKEANEHLRKLEADIPTVSLRVQGAAAGDELLLDRRRLPIDDRPLPIRADPGPHTAEVRRGDALLAREYFALDPKSTRRVELRIGTVAPESAGGGSSAATPSPGRVQRALGWTAVGVGGASAILTGVFVGLRAGAMSRLTLGCPSLTHCPQSVAPIVGEGKTDAALVNVFGVLGGVATAAGVALLLTAPSSQPQAQGRAAPPAAWIELGAGGGFAVRGSF